MAGRNLRFDAAQAALVRHLHGSLNDPDEASGRASDADASTESVNQPINSSVRQPINSVEPDELVRTNSNWPFALQQTVQRELMSDPAITASSLVISPTEDGICLEGILETSGEIPDVERLIRNVAEVNQILNRLVVRQVHRKARTDTD